MRCSYSSGAGAAKFVKDYEAAGLKASLPLYAPGFPHRRHAEAMGGAGEGRADHAALRRRPETPEGQSFRAGLCRKTVQGCNPTSSRCRATTARASSLGPPGAGRSDVSTGGHEGDERRHHRQPAVLTPVRANNPVQDIYLRKVEGGRTR